MKKMLALLAGLALSTQSMALTQITGVMDFEGDKIRKTKSFPYYLGIKKSNFMASLLIIMAVIMSFIPFLFNFDERYYHSMLFLSLLIPSDTIFVYSSYLAIKNDARAREYTLFAMLIALLAFLIPSLTFIK